MDYKAMLKEAKESLPEPKKSAERFEIPKVRGQIEGSKTIVSNFYQIADILGRKPQHLLKYVLKELATPGTFRGQAVIFGSKLSASKINEKIAQYSEEFVFCKECGKPDTKMTKEGDIYYLRCQVCGARYSFHAKI
ncbi:MAG: translation initiation factor IF-2 subunit beta [Candidatus Woesearchaeota archaeon]